MGGVDTGEVVEMVELVEVGESGSGGSSGGDGANDEWSSAVAVVGVAVVGSSRLLIRSSSDGCALSRGLPNPNIRSPEMVEIRCY